MTIQYPNTTEQAIQMIEEHIDTGTKIKVIGVGGCGCNAINHMIERNVQGVEFVSTNTDAQSLRTNLASNIIQLGKTGRGAGVNPEVGRSTAQMAEAEIRAQLEGTQMLFITAGMGGGTGTGAAPVIARIAKEMNILTVGVVTKPFEHEGTRCMKMAEAGLAELEQHVNSLIVILNEKLLDFLGADVTEEEAFAYSNDVLKNAVGGIAEIINVVGNRNVDFEDVKTVMNETGKAMMGKATASGPDRARIAAEQAMTCPLIDGVDLTGAKALLILVSAAHGSLKLSEVKTVVNTIKATAADNALILDGSAYDDSLGDELRVTVVATGLNDTSKTTAPDIHVLVNNRTGTDHNNSTAYDPTTGHMNTRATHTIPPSQNTLNTNQGTNFNADLNIPTILRRNPDRSQAVMQNSQFNSSSINNFDLPAFLRQQAD